MLSILHSQGRFKNPHLLKNETYLILLKELLHVSVRFCVFVLNNEFTPAMANLKKRENPISNKLVGFSWPCKFNDGTFPIRRSYSVNTVETLKFHFNVLQKKGTTLFVKRGLPVNFRGRKCMFYLGVLMF